MKKLLNDRANEAMVSLPRTRRGAAWMLVAVILLLVLGFVAMLLVYLPDGRDAVATRVLIPWMWIAISIILGIVLMAQIWAPYRLRALKLWRSGVRFRFVIVGLTAAEKKALARLFDKDALANTRDLAMVMTVNAEGIAFWNRVDRLPVGVIPWAEVGDIRAVDTVRDGTQSPELEITLSRLASPLSFTLIGFSPMSLVTMGVSRIAKVATKLRAERGSDEVSASSKVSKPVTKPRAVVVKTTERGVSNVKARILWVSFSLIAVLIIQGLPSLVVPSLLEGIDLGAASDVTQMFTSPAIAVSTLFFACGLGIACAVTWRRSLSFWWTLGISVYATVLFTLAYALITGGGIGSLANMGALELDLIRAGAIPTQIVVPPLVGLLMRLKAATNHSTLALQDDEDC